MASGILQQCAFIVAGVSDSSTASSVPLVNQAPSSSPPTPVESQLGTKIMTLSLYAFKYNYVTLQQYESLVNSVRHVN